MAEWVYWEPTDPAPLLTSVCPSWALHLPPDIPLAAEAEEAILAQHSSHRSAGWEPSQHLAQAALAQGFGSSYL